MDGWIWLAWVFAFLVFEGFALWNDKDDTRPLTFHIRRAFSLDRYGWGWFVVAAFITWLAHHFLVAS